VWRARPIAVLLVGLGLLVLVAAANLGRGDFPISVLEVLTVFTGGGDDLQRTIVLELRLPRTLTGALVGAALGLSGAITQSVARNPLASPDILGVTAGATVGAVAVLVFGAGSTFVSTVLTEVGLPVAALAGGLGTAALVYLLAYRRGIDGYRLVLVGVGIGSIGVSLTSWMLVGARAQDAARATVWFTGSLNGRGWEHVTPVGLALLVVVPLVPVLAYRLGALQFDDDTARGIGSRLTPSRTGLVLAAVALAGVATSSAGPILFVALVAPQICLRLARTPQPPLLVSAVYGALLTVTADLIARTTLGVEIPVGIVTAILGAPYLIHQLSRNNRKVSA
jgi:iron complex transport system permease protein